MNDEPIKDDRFRKASSLIRSGKPDLAIPVLKELIRQYSKNIYLYRELGFARQFTKDFKGAIEVFSTVISDRPNDSRGFTWRAAVYERVGDISGVIQDYTSAIGIEPEHSIAYLHRGRAKLRLEDWEGAIEDFSFAIEFDDHDALPGLLNRGKAKRMAGDLAGAINDLDRAFELEVVPAIYAPLERARVRRELRDWAGAIQDYSLAITGYPELSNAYRERADVYRQIGDEKAAALDDAEYLRLGGNDLPAYQ
jgi:tetratricopeptide (TPR) repeat protein